MIEIVSDGNQTDIINNNGCNDQPVISRSVIPTPPPLPPVSKVNFTFKCNGKRNTKNESLASTTTTTTTTTTTLTSTPENRKNSFDSFLSGLHLGCILKERDLLNNFPMDSDIFWSDDFLDNRDSNYQHIKQQTTITTTTSSISTSTIGIELSDTSATNTSCCSSSSSVNSSPAVEDDTSYQAKGGECPICLDTYDVMVEFPVCNHTYCLSCTESHLREQVWRFKGKKLSCPDPKCNHSLLSDEKFNSKFLDKVSHDKLELYKVINNKLFGDKNIIFCLSCFHPLSKPSGTDMTIICDNSECKLELCYECATESHHGMTCEENKKYIFDTLSEDEKKSLKYLEAEQYKACPKCGITTYKEDGCEYVYCLACGHQFCYFCLEPHDHNLSTHVHGPKYVAPKYDNYYNYAYHQRRGFFQRHYKIKHAATCFALGVGAVIVGPPVIVVGAIPYATYRLATHIRKVMKQRKLTQKKCNFDNWVLEEKKRREALGLEVSDYINENYNKLNVKST
ncbi:hypothetical protein PPL_02884 [Heterostelium album PN500]|uniref:RING-type domain-containing protein n=1 Tax=Heterostelium pallidum (strain ATCC 26659 / Pp 5 / PN500) TaxID=670386 RepID=D3B3B8_HETP5|nr:hypothetical protein PPL_02884 [Heterostelium album PN500]EFA83816.1 hypothetical protein PPL_02884 [Heterostelium album PN500]|eukprot:XP_020435933.1 hypothetical protein PPL_02884 [Heterostelium album PN500]